MRSVTLGALTQEPTTTFDKWVRESLKKIETASRQDVVTTVGNSGQALVSLSNAAANTIPLFTGPTTATTTSCTPFTQTLLALTDAAHWLAAIGGGVSGTALLIANNLSDVASAATSRTNLNVPSKTEALLVANNLSDLGSASTARTNLGVAYGKHSIWVPATAMKPRITNGASGPNDTETATNFVQINGLDFSNSTVQYAQFFISMPKSWDQSTLTAVFYWSHPATTVHFGVVWEIQAVAIPTGTAMDVAFGTAQSVTSTGGTTNDLYQSSETSAITVGGTLGADVYTAFQVFRNAGGGGDNLAVAARLLGVRILYNTNANSDT